MKKLFIVLMLLGMCVTAFADEFKVPFSCYPKQLQQDLLAQGLKFDLSANDRKKDSVGFIESRGSSYSIFTYEPATPKQMDIILKVVMSEMQQK
jgi:hypothetical protein